MTTDDSSQKNRITLERTFKASPREVWDLWTTKDGIESWWGPEGFRVEVRTIDLRVGGVLEYAMIATAAPQIDFMKKAGMPLVTETRFTFIELTPHTRLAYTVLADFIPGVKPYETRTAVEIEPNRDGVRMRVLLDPMHDEMWSKRMSMGMEGQLGKLEKHFAQHTVRSSEAL